MEKKSKTSTAPEAEVPGEKKTPDGVFELSEAAFVGLFRPEPSDQGHPFGRWYGLGDWNAEHDLVLAAKPRKVWSVRAEDDGVFLSSGYSRSADAWVLTERSWPKYSKVYVSEKP